MKKTVIFLKNEKTMRRKYEKTGAFQAFVTPALDSVILLSYNVTECML